LGDVKIILEIRLKDLVTIVVLGLIAGLRKVGNVAHQQIGEGISCGNGRRVVKAEESIDRGLKPTEFVLLRCNEVRAELQIVPSDDLVDIVAKCIGWI